TQNGIDVALNQAFAASVHVINTVLKNNGGVGIRATNAVTPFVQVGISETSVILDNIGIEAAQHSRVVVSSSFISKATTDGLRSDDATTSDAQMTVTNSESSHSSNGFTALAGGNIVVGGSTAAYNSSCGFNGSGG